VRTAKSTVWTLVIGVLAVHYSFGAFTCQAIGASSKRMKEKVQNKNLLFKFALNSFEALT